MVRGILVMAQQLHGIGMHGAFRVTARAIGLELPMPQAVQDTFGHDAAGGIARTEKQDVEDRRITHKHSPWRFHNAW